MDETWVYYSKWNKFDRERQILYDLIYFVVVVHCLVTKLCPTLVTPWTVGHQQLCPWDFPGKNTRLGCHFLLQRIFPTQELNLHLLHRRQILYHWAMGEASRSLISGILKKFFFKYSEVESRLVVGKDRSRDGEWVKVGVKAYKLPVFRWVTSGDIMYSIVNNTVLHIWKKVKVKVIQSWLFVTPWTIYSLWNSPGQNTGMDSLALLQGIFSTQGSNPGLSIAGKFFTNWATREALNIWKLLKEWILKALIAHTKIVAMWGDGCVNLIE